MKIEDEPAGDYALQIADDLAIGAPTRCEPAEYFNHSCDPNAGITGQIVPVALRAIAPDCEVCFDYAMVVSSRSYQFVCHCGTRDCRRTVTGSDWKIPELQQRYRGYFSLYLQDRISRLKSAQLRGAPIRRRK